MSVKMTWVGLDDYRRQLLALPKEFANEAANVVVATAEQTGQGVSSNYPLGPTGNLRHGVKVVVHRNQFSTTAAVVSASPHAHLYENGTGLRQTRRGANRGRMPQGLESTRVIPRAVRARRRMIEALIQIVKDAGLIVSTT